jgi:3-hydroxyacyl-[acyl-carrier-protein] dehydratase
MIDILKSLPHRYPFLMVDQVISIDVDLGTIIALKNITNNEPQFQGHFPDKPVMPGMFILEAMLQTGGLLAGHTLGGPVEKRIGYVATVDKVRFRHPVTPGDQLYLHATILNKQMTAWRFMGKVYVDKIVVAEATWMTIIPEVINE